MGYWWVSVSVLSAFADQGGAAYFIEGAARGHQAADQQGGAEPAYP